MGDLRARRQRRCAGEFLFHLEGALFELADALEVLGDASLGRRTQRGVGAGVKLVLPHDGVEHAALEPLLAGIPADIDGHHAEHAVKQVARLLLHRPGDGAVGVIAVHVSPDAAPAKVRPADQRRHHSDRHAVGIKSFANDLVNGGAAGLGLAPGRHGRERAGRAVVVGVDAADVAANLIHLAHDEQLVAEWLERLEHAFEPLRLQRGGHAEPEKHVERPHRHGLGFRGQCHFLQQRQADRDATQALERGSSVHSVHQFASVCVFCTRSLFMMARIRLA